jgi:uncharacterized protein YcaQ
METSKVKTLYENELGISTKNEFRFYFQFFLDDAKKLIEELAHEKSRLEIEVEKGRSENADIQAK